MSDRSLKRAAALLLALAASAGCGGGGQPAEQTGPLGVYEASLWPSATIPVCFVTPNAATAEQLQWVKDGAARWEAVSALTFEWGTCAAGTLTEGILIRFSDEREHVDWLGQRPLEGSSLGYARMSLNATYLLDKETCASDAPFSDPRGFQWPRTIQYCMTAAAAHEFGHALGFSHEYARTDTPDDTMTPSNCTTSENHWTTPYGWFDPYSVMLQSYCGINSMGYLSPTDVAGVQHYYGHRSDDYLWRADGNVASLMHDWAQWPPGYSLPARLGVTVRAEAVGGQYPLAFTGDFDGDGHSDVFWYVPGPGGDSLWFGGPGATWTKRPGTDVSGTYVPIAGDFDCDGRDDVFWYGRGTGRETVWWGRADGTFLHARTRPVGGSTYRPVAGDFDGDRCDDIFWYAPFTGFDSVWFGSPAGDFQRRVPTLKVFGAYQPFAGDFDGDGRTDVFLYAAGNLRHSPDGVLWANGGARVFEPREDFPVSGAYRLAVGDFDGNGTADLLFDDPAGPFDHLWLWRHGQRAYADTVTSVLGSYLPLVGDFDGDGLDDVFWHGAGL